MRSTLPQQAVRRATDACPDLARKRVTPHVVRHMTALHLLQTGFHIAVIALWLEHENIETTHGYLEADPETEQRALGWATPAMGTVSRFKASDSLLQFLSKLRASPPAGTRSSVLAGRTFRSRRIVEVRLP